MDWERIVNDAHAATEKHGIPMRGRKYLQVQHRVEMFRLNFGDYGIETTLLHFGKLKGESIVVQAVIKNPDGRTVASGIAEEVRGQGAVNTTSAIENAETSAIGRALACLGLHGGEFASINEIERAQDPEAKRAAEEAQKPKEQPRDPRKIADSLIGRVSKATNYADVDAIIGNEKFEAAWQWLAENDPPKSNEVKKAVNDMRNKFDPAGQGPHTMAAE